MANTNLHPQPANSVRETPNCPACNSTRNHDVRQLTSYQATQHFVRDYLDPERHKRLFELIRKLWQGDTAQLQLCDDCGLRFALPLEAGSPEFYNLAYPGDPVYPAERWEFGRTLQHLQDTPATEREALVVLEVGAGDGAFVQRLPSYGFKPANISALEYNDVALQRLRNLGFSASNADFIRFDADRSIDAIFMFQVLEHMGNPGAVFETIARLLSDDGHAYIAVPNASRIEFNESNDSMIDMPPNHVTRWTLQAFEKICARHGLQVVEHEVQTGTLSAFLTQDIGYTYLQRTNDAKSWFARTYRRDGSITEKAMRSVAALCIAVQRLPLWFATLPTLSTLGGTTWVKVRRLSE